jgi:sugar lactone lactonase YvrE
VGTANNGPLVTDAKVLQVDPDTGAVSTYAEGLGGIDGIALAPDGSVYTTTFAGVDIGRVSPTGIVEPHWANVLSPNGIGVSPDGRYVYVIQTAPAPVLYRIAVDAPGQPQRWITADLLDALAIPDGLTLDRNGVPLIATHVAGQGWRVQNGRFCAVYSGLFGTTQLTYGHGSTGFSAGRLYRAGIDGGIYEFPAGFDPNGR